MYIAAAQRLLYDAEINLVTIYDLRLWPSCRYVKLKSFLTKLQLKILAC